MTFQEMKCGNWPWMCRAVFSLYFSRFVADVNVIVNVNVDDFIISVWGWVEEI